MSASRPVPITTPYGPCDAAALKRLRESFDTAKLLDAVDELNEVGSLLIDPDELRAELLELHAMAHTVLNGAALSVAPGRKRLTDVASEIEAQLDDLTQTLLAIREQVHALTMLAPQEDDCDDTE